MHTIEMLLKSAAEAVLHEVSAEREKNAKERGQLLQKDVYLDGVGEGVRCFVEEFTKQLKSMSVQNGSAEAEGAVP